MFNKAKESTPEAVTPASAPAPVQPVQSQSPSQSQMQAQAQKRPPTPRATPSVISADLVVTGTLSSTGDMQVDGRVEGDVHSAALIVGEKAVIQGEVIADEVTVRGRVEGSIRARKILLCSSCHVEGNILHEAFAVEAGAFFEGNCRHSDNPLGDQAGRRNSPERRTTQISSSASGANGGSLPSGKPLEPSQPRAAIVTPASAG